MILVTLSPLANHLWQSTICAVVVWLLTLALRKNRAAVRYWLWLAASIKFLIPFSFLVSTGSRFGWRATPAIRPHQFSLLMDEISRPFALSTPVPRLIDAPVATNEFSAIFFGLWFCGFTILFISWFRSWRHIRAVQRTAIPLHLNLPIQVMSSPARLEPGVFGIRKPVLLLPEGITDRLTPLQLEAVLAHELCHVRRHDNLTAVIHMVVEAIFWFHPLVWWIRIRLVEERERACDEEVLRVAKDPQVYAEGILNVCKFYLESPLVCASGVTGADLKKRIEKIMAHRNAHKLDWRRKSLLAAAGVAAVIGPVAIGVMCAPSSRAQSQTAGANPSAFEVASVKPSKSANGRNSMDRSPSGGFTATNATLKMLVKAAYSVQDHQLIGGPGWLDSERYDIVAKAPPHTPDSQLGTMIRTLLADRFKVQVHRETRQMPVYALVLGKDGPKFQEVKREAKDGDGDSRKGRGHLSAQRVPISDLAEILSGELGLSVLDRTGLKGLFDLKLEWTPDESQPRSPGDNLDGRVSNPTPDRVGPSLFTALQEQLGLRLEKRIGPVEVLVIDHVERPSEN